MNSRQNRRILVTIFLSFPVIGLTSSAHAQGTLQTATPANQSTTTTLYQGTENEPAQTGDVSSVTFSQPAKVDIETTRARFDSGSPIVQALESSGLFKSASLMSTTESVIVSQLAGCETKASRQFYYVQPASRMAGVDPFLIESQVVNVRPLDSRCVTNNSTVTMKGPFKSYNKIKSPGSGRADAKMRNFFEMVYSHDTVSNALTFRIANESYLKFFRRLQVGGLLAQDSALSGSVVLATVAPKLKQTLIEINGGGTK